MAAEPLLSMMVGEEDLFDFDFSNEVALSGSAVLTGTPTITKTPATGIALSGIVVDAPSKRVQVLIAATVAGAYHLTCVAAHTGTGGGPLIRCGTLYVVEC